MSEEIKCPICAQVNVSVSWCGNLDNVPISCARCGSFHTTHMFAKAFEKTPADTEWRWQLSAVVRAASDLPPNRFRKVITHDNYQAIVDGAPKPQHPLEQADYLIAAIARRSRLLGGRTGEDKPNSVHPWVARAWVENVDELLLLNAELAQLGLLKCATGVRGTDPAPEFGKGYWYQLTHKGWERARQLLRTRGPGNQAFVAMWFNSDLSNLYDSGIAPALRETGFQPFRVDRDTSADMIDNRIVAEIRRSRLIVADCTGARPSVYFEAGLAMGLGIDVIWCCHLRTPVDSTCNQLVEVPPPNAEMGACWSKSLAFDTRQYPHILWSTPEQLQKELVNCIHARGLDIVQSR